VVIELSGKKRSKMIQAEKKKKKKKKKHAALNHAEPSPNKKPQQ
jgi:hypothetical protein